MKNTPLVIPNRQVLQDPLTRNLFHKLCHHFVPVFAKGRMHVFPRDGSRAGRQECSHERNVEPKHRRVIRVVGPESTLY